MTSFGGWLREAGRWRRPRPSPAACDTSGAPPRLSLAFTSANSFNALRLTFASTVLAVHAVAFGGFSDRPVQDFDLAALAVDGFFVLSGFLIVRSRLRCRSTARYLWHRAVRIMPAFWLCQLVVTFIVAPLAWLYTRGTLAGYLTASPHGPFAYLLGGLTPRISFLDIAGTPADVPFPPAGSGIPAAWNGNLWTLWWELLCYLGVAALAVAGLLRRRVIAGLVGAMLTTLLVIKLDPTRAGELLGATFSGSYGRFATLFLCGALMSVYAHRIPCSRLLAAGSAVLVVVAYYDHGTGLRTLEHTSVDYLVGALPLAYLCIWLGIRLPLRGFGKWPDLSYGVYIYGSPVQQLAAVYGVHRLGFGPYLVVTIAVTFVLATVSWFALEKPAHALRSWTPGAFSRLRAASPTSRAIWPINAHIPRQRTSSLRDSSPGAPAGAGAIPAAPDGTPASGGEVASRES